MALRIYNKGNFYIVTDLIGPDLGLVNVVVFFL